MRLPRTDVVPLLAIIALAIVAVPVSGQDVTGTWALFVDLGAGASGEGLFVFEQEGTVITGTYSGAYGTGVEVSGTAEDGQIMFSFRTGQVGLISYDGAIEGDTMTGTVVYGGSAYGASASGTFGGSLAEPISAEEIATYEGVYELAPGREVTVFSRGGQLFAQATGQGAFRLKAQGDHAFIASFDDNVRVEFVVEDGTATTFILFQNGRTEVPRVR